MIEESKYCSEVMKKRFNKELVMTKEDKEDFKNSAECWISDNDYNDHTVKIRRCCHITRKCTDSARRNYNINLKLSLKFTVVFHNLKNYDSHPIVQELGK